MYIPCPYSTFQTLVSTLSTLLYCTFLFKNYQYYLFQSPIYYMLLIVPRPFLADSRASESDSHARTRTRTMTNTTMHRPAPVDVLILGAGWTSTFLIPLLSASSISFAATSRSGTPRSGHPTIQFTFDPSNDDPEPFSKLPVAKTVLVTFPIRVAGASGRLVRLWRETHGGSETGFIQLGSSGIWNVRSRLFCLFSCTHISFIWNSKTPYSNVIGRPGIEGRPAKVADMA